MLMAVSCITVACNACGEQLKDEEDGSVLHFSKVLGAVKYTESGDWVVSVDGYAVCGTTDAEHQAALDAMLPPEPAPVIDGQEELPW